MLGSFTEPIVGILPNELFSVKLMFYVGAMNLVPSFF